MEDLRVVLKPAWLLTGCFELSSHFNELNAFGAFSLNELVERIPLEP